MTEISRCVACGGGTVAPDGHCWDCGTAQPAFRSHVELTTDAGAAGVSDRGLRRAVNADAMALSRAGAWTVGVVCDGVSMSPRSERAAQVAADAGAATTIALLRAGALPETALAEGAIRAGRAVTALAGSLQGSGPGRPRDAPAQDAPACTYVAGVAARDGVWACWVGDSRAYWLPGEGVATAMTEDDTGEHEALSAWLGADAGRPEPRIRSYRPSTPGLLLLCTDGLWRHFPDASALRDQARAGALRGRAPAGSGRAPGDDLPGRAGSGAPGAARALVDHALAAGGQDNITALLLPAGPRSRPG
ncbi:serine/threonine protein phosphatase PrpC [Nonomuraea thailandensis]|uniref:Serine/threonine protein phosphatase PrpC n=1 Tax=Nonomuraea thailandensis TaxID=1188745 RepID=A0A9X2GJ73_9ACTN|nr:protein phosphatase 2C domain-containing protein [Nonomuraea thailandensis]MCP2359856.1 serine/threonine protein phosphatase PrpC [Nonomuraea thailandensis]